MVCVNWPSVQDSEILDESGVAMLQDCEMKMLFGVIYHSWFLCIALVINNS